MQNKVNRIVDELDPDKYLCLTCKKYKHINQFTYDGNFQLRSSCETCTKDHEDRVTHYRMNRPSK